MRKLELRWSFSFLIPALIAITILSFVPPSYADRVITVEKSADVNEDSLIHTISDISEYSKIFPENVKYVKLLDNKTKLVEMNAGINGIFFDTQAICKTGLDGSYVIEVVSGDLKGTIMTTKLQKTWGFHGEKDKGTLANISLDVKSTGFLSVILNFVPDNSLTYVVQNGFDRFVQYTQLSS